MQIPSKQVSCAVLFFIFALFSSYASNASEIDEEALIQQIVDIDLNTSATPKEVLATLAPIIEQAKTNNYKTALLKGLLLESSYYSYQDNIAMAKEKWLPAYNLAKELNDINALIELESLSLVFTYPFNGVNTVLEKHQILLEMSKQVESPELLGYVYESLGNSHHADYKESQAIEYLQTAYQYYSKVENTDLSESVLSSLGTLYLDIDEPKMALDYFDQAELLIKESGNQFSLSVTLYNKSVAYFNLHDFDKAIEFSSQALKLSQLLEDDIGVAWAQEHLARAYMELGNWEIALPLLRASFAKFEEVQDDTNAALTFVSLIRATAKTGEAQKALYMIDDAKAMLTRANSSELSIKLEKIHAEVLYANRDYQKAYNQLMVYLESLKQSEQKDEDELVQKYRVQFESELKDSLNESLEKQVELTELQLQQTEQVERLWIAIAMIGFLAGGLVTILLIKQVKNRNSYKALAFTDVLTDSPNRRAVLSHAQRIFEEMKNGQRRAQDGDMVICILDLDYFKTINDQFGHDVGDDILVVFARACAHSIREDDFFGRYGGEEWLLVLQNLSEKDIERVFLRIKQNVNKNKPQSIPQDKEITFSMGCAFASPADKDINTLIKKADESLYQAKVSGRDCFVITKN